MTKQEYSDLCIEHIKLMERFDVRLGVMEKKMDLVLASVRPTDSQRLPAPPAPEPKPEHKHPWWYYAVLCIVLLAGALGVGQAANLTR